MRYKIIGSLHKRGYHACFVACLSICGTVCQGCVLGVLGFLKRSDELERVFFHQIMKVQ